MPAAPDSLPIHAHRESILAALQRCPRLLLQAPTGSGKSTQVPRFVLESCGSEEGEIVVLQPRRLATRMLATRVAAEYGERPGQTIGYQIRFDRVAGPKTRVRFVTEGLLLRQMLADPLLKGVHTLVFDEFHERNLHTDIALALARRLQDRRSPVLRLIVMSATLDTQELAQWLAPCETLHIEGRTFPISIAYTAPNPRQRETPLWELAAAHYERLAPAHPEGDCLIFMPGGYEIRRTLEALRQTRAGREAALFALHGELPPEEQDRALAPSPHQRKVIVATNVAETSLTIPGIRLVIDSGLARVAAYDSRRSLNTLLIEKISRASAEQRAGRAGRTAPGHVLRLWTEADHATRPERQIPEIRRVDLAETLLTLLAGGIDIPGFCWFEAPTPEALQRAWQLLADLGATEGVQGRLTDLGQRMAAFPLHPRYARMLLAAEEEGCVSEACLAAAITQGRDLLLPLHDSHQRAAREAWLAGEDDRSDFFPLLRALQSAQQKHFDPEWCRQWGIHGLACRQATQAAAQFLRIAQMQGLDLRSGEEPMQGLRRCLLAAFSDHLAMRRDSGTLQCRLLHQRRGELRRTSVVDKAPLFVAADMEEIETRGEKTVLLGLATAIEDSWLQERFPKDFVVDDAFAYDPVQRRVLYRRERRFRDLVLESRESGTPPPADAAARLLAERVLSGELPLKGWDEGVEAWIARVNFLAHHYPEYGVGVVDASGRALLIEHLCHGAFSYRDIKHRDPWPILRAWLSHEQEAALAYAAPPVLLLPRRKRPAPLRYDAQHRAILAATVQELYDVPPSLLRLGDGRVPLLIEVLAPNRRPVQLTQDLEAFWKTSYPQVRKDLFGRYPKHEWR